MAASSIFRFASTAITGGGNGSSGTTVQVNPGDIFIAFAFNNSTTGTFLPTLAFSGVAQTITLIASATGGAAPQTRAYVVTNTPTGSQQIDFGYNISGGTQATVAWYHITGNAIVQGYSVNNNTGTSATWSLPVTPMPGWLSLLGVGTTSNVSGGFGGGSWTTNGATTQFSSSVSNDNPPPQNAAYNFGSSQNWSGVYVTVGEPRYDVIGPTFPTSVSTTGGSTPWTGVSNIVASDNLVATVVPAQTNTSNTYIDVTGFNLNIPAAGSLYGIIAEVEGYTDGAATIDSIQLLQGGSPIGTAYSPARTLSNVEALNTFSNGMWGAALTSSIVNASDFGVRIRFKAGISYFNSYLTINDYNYPDDATSAGGTVSWVNPSNATVDDGTTTTQVSLAAASNDYLKLTNFGFNLPTNANVTSIYTFFNRARSGGTIGNISTNVHQLCYNNALIGTNYGGAGNWTTGLSTEYGNFTPTISAANVNDPSFGMWIRTNAVGGNTTTSAVFATGAASVGSGIAWTNPANAKASDSTYATFLLNGTTATTLSNHQGLSLTGYGFSIPTNATIVGIVASIRRIQVGSTGAGSVRTGTVQFMKAGVPGGTNLATTTAFSTTVGAANFGTASSLSGQTFTPADINDPNFGVYIQLQGVAANASRTGGIDSASIAVTYSMPSDRVAEIDSGFMQVYYNVADTTQVTYIDSVRMYAQTQGAPRFQFSLNQTEQMDAQMMRQRGFVAQVTESLATAYALSIESSIVPKLFGFNVNEVEALAISMLRARGLVLTHTETETIAFDVMKRARKIASTINESETVSTAMSRARSMAMVINEAEVISAALARMRYLASTINEAESVTIQLQKIKGLSMLVNETYAMTIDTIKRVRGLKPTVNESESVSIAIGRLLKLGASIAETEALFLQLARNRGFNPTVNETESVLAALARQRQAAFNVNELESVTTALARKRFSVLNTVESETMSAAILRNRGFAPTTMENETTSAAFARQRQMIPYIVENEALSLVMGRKRGQSTVVNEFENIYFSLARLRGMGTVVNEMETFSFVFNKLKSLTMAIVETESMSVSLSRTLRMALLLEEVENVSASVKRARSIVATLPEQELMTAMISRARKIGASIVEVESMSATLARIRSVGFNWTETESVAYYLAKTKFMTMTIMQNLNVQVGAMGRVRGLGVTLPEHASYLAAIQRVRNMNTVVIENENLTINYNRFRGMVTDVIEHQGMTAGTLRRIREFAADIVETYACDIRVSIYQPEAGRLVMTATFEQWVAKPDGTLDLQTKSMSWEIVRRADDVVIDMPLTETVLLNIPYNPSNTPEIGDLLDAGFNLI